MGLRRTMNVRFGVTIPWRSCSTQVRALLRALTPKVAECTEQLLGLHVGQAVCASRGAGAHIYSEYPVEVTWILSVRAPSS